MRRNAAKHPATTTNGVPIGVPGVLKIYEAALQDRDTWFAAFGVVDEMRRTRGGKQVLERLVETKGDMDWVWLETHVGEQSPSSDPDQLRLFNERYLTGMDQDASDDIVVLLYYVATFTLVVAYLRALHPGIMPPSWWWSDMGAIRGEPFVDKGVADVVKDAFLEGRDDEGIAVLLDSIR